MTLQVDHEPLRGVVSTPGKAGASSVALLLHGGPGGTKEGPEQLFVHLAASLADAGIASARFDFLGAGESGGDYIDTGPAHQAAQYRHMIRWLRAQGFSRVGVVGESFGATCALGGYRTSEVDALVLLWPAIWLLDGAFAPFVNPERRAEVREHGYFTTEGQHIGAAFIDDLLANDNRERELMTIAAPTLLIHGDADTEVPVRQSRRAFDLLDGPRRLVIVPAADHCLRRPGDQAVTIRETTGWLSSYLSTPVA